MSLQDKTVSGILWSALARIGQEGMGFLTTLVLARLLSPDAFGLLGMVIVFTGFISMFQNLGLGPSIIQDREISQEQLSGIFWLNIGFSTLLALLTIGSAPLVSIFFNEPSITFIMMVLALNFPLSALAMVPDALLKKRMAFKKLAVIRNIATAVGSAVGITTAFMGMGVWALVWQGISHTFTKTLLEWIVVSWNPTWTLPYRKLKRQLQFGINLQAGSLLNYGSRNVDDLLIGKVIGASALGLYQMAYRLMLWPLQKVSGVVGEVMFPALSTIKDDTERVKSVFLRATRSIGFTTFPMVLGLWVIAPSAVYAVLGEKWAGVIPIFQVLCILGLTQSIATNTGWIFLSQGRTDIRLKLQIAFSTLFITSFIIGIHWGAMGVAVCYTVASLLATPIQFQVAGRLINMTFRDIVHAVASVFGCAVVMSVLVLGLGYVLPANWPHWAYLAVQVPFGIVVYVALVHIFDLTAYRDLRGLLEEQWQQHRNRKKKA
ncbi:lipopolysaccharide biosynthesis protein WzxC [bacterium BMS3Abin10]|nr:lipopolysaccharide biosynthesis protein WzxC [bacterium BMS3Abin10]GBE39179.1 lipopolysaccharide biosynthesis protein WzxC [bacterium BMS3Bbin08]